MVCVYTHKHVFLAPWSPFSALGPTSDNEYICFYAPFSAIVYGFFV